MSISEPYNKQSDTTYVYEVIESYWDKETALKQKKDIAPVRNAISSSISSGFVEGGNCRYKETKRLMFGRSGLHHLFLKIYATSIIMRQGKSISTLLEDWINSGPVIPATNKKRKSSNSVNSFVLFLFFTRLE